jgi:hypothetical protein
LDVGYLEKRVCGPVVQEDRERVATARRRRRENGFVPQVMRRLADLLGDYWIVARQIGFADVEGRSDIRVGQVQNARQADPDRRQPPGPHHRGCLYFVFAKDDIAYGDTAFVVERYRLEFSRMPELVLHRSICAMCYPDAKEKLAEIGLGWSDLPHADATGHVERLEQSNLLGCGLYDGDLIRIESILGEYASDYRSCPRHPDRQAE